MLSQRYWSRHSRFTKIDQGVVYSAKGQVCSHMMEANLIRHMQGYGSCPPGQFLNY